MALVFLAWFALFEALIWWAALSGGMGWLMLGTARLIATLTSWLGIPVTLNGIQIALRSNILEIDLDCTAIQVVALYSALILAYPVSIRTRLVGLAVGILTILIANVLRLMGVVIASESLSTQIFLFVHDYLFKVLMMLVVFGLWAWWLTMARRDEARA